MRRFKIRVRFEGHAAYIDRIVSAVNSEEALKGCCLDLELNYGLIRTPEELEIEEIQKGKETT